MDYLLARGLQPEEIDEYRCFVPRGLPEYVAFPLDLPPGGRQRPADELWTARRLVPGQPRWRSSAGLGAALWGLERLLPGQVAVVTEGIFDAAHFNRLPERTGIACLRLSPLEIQAKAILDRGPSRVIIAPDAGVSDAIIEENKRVFLRLDRRLDVVVERPPDGFEDFGEMLKEMS